MNKLHRFYFCRKYGSKRIRDLKGHLTKLTLTLTFTEIKSAKSVTLKDIKLSYQESPKAKVNTFTNNETIPEYKSFYALWLL